MRDIDQTVVYLMRIYHWSLEYTTALVQRLPLRKLNKLISETQAQERKARYEEASNFAMICAVLVNLQSKDKRSIEDFIGRPPQTSKPKKETIVDLVRNQLKLKIPK